MSRDAQIPGGLGVQETGTRDAQIPGGLGVQETQSAGVTFNAAWAVAANTLISAGATLA